MTTTNRALQAKAELIPAFGFGIFRDVKIVQYPDRPHMFVSDGRVIAAEKNIILPYRLLDHQIGGETAQQGAKRSCHEVIFFSRFFGDPLANELIVIVDGGIGIRQKTQQRDQDKSNQKVFHGASNSRVFYESLRSLLELEHILTLPIKNKFAWRFFRPWLNPT
jgi:hypothetical protein